MTAHIDMYYNRCCQQYLSTVKYLSFSRVVVHTPKTTSNTKTPKSPSHQKRFCTEKFSSTTPSGSTNRTKPTPKTPDKQRPTQAPQQQYSNAQPHHHTPKLPRFASPWISGLSRTCIVVKITPPIIASHQVKASLSSCLQ